MASAFGNECGSQPCTLLFYTLLVFFLMSLVGKFMGDSINFMPIYLNYLFINFKKNSLSDLLSMRNIAPQYNIAKVKPFIKNNTH